MTELSYKDHLQSYESLVTPYEQTRAGFISLALEKNRKATPYVEEAKAIKVIAGKTTTPKDLLDIKEIRPAILTASGVSDKASNHLTDDDKNEAIIGLIENFLEPAGKDYIDELIYRFLLTRGDSLGGSMRNLAGALGERKLSRTIIATLTVQGVDFKWLHSKSKRWIKGNEDNADIEIHMKGLHWNNDNGDRTLIYNLTVPIVRKNVDLCLFDAVPSDYIAGKNKSSCHQKPDTYIALGELKGGIDPAGADEHWKTANTALDRIRTSFQGQNLRPKTFFVGAAIENAMAEEIFGQLESDVMTNAGNLTDDSQLISVCNWLINI